MRLYSTLVVLLAVLLPSVARAQAPGTPPPSAPKPPAQPVVAYRSVSWEPVLPTFALSSNTDGSNSVAFSAPFVADTIPDHPEPAVHVTSWTIAPTATFTDNSKSPVITVGAPGGGPNFGLTSLSWGILLGYTRQAPLLVEEELGVIVELAPLRVQAALACKARCSAAPATEDAEFCKAAAAPGFDVNAVDASSLCPTGKTQLIAATKAPAEAAVGKIGKLRAQRLRFPEIDLSVWGGGGASEFAFYQQTAAAAGTSPATYGSTTQWHPNVAGAAALNAVPWVGDGPLGLTFEIPVFVKDAYQASKKSGSACSSPGMVTSTTTLSSCGSSEPIGGPSVGALLTAKGYVGIIDRENAYWRVAAGVGYTRNFVDSTDTWSIELPVYINATGLGGSKGASSGGGGDSSSSSAQNPIQVAYNGIVRITPAVQHSFVSGTPGWSAVLNFDLLGQRNMFVRADTLVK